MGYFMKSPKADILAHFAGDIQSLDTTITIPLLTLLRAIMAIVFTIATLFYLQPLFAAITVLTFPLIFGVPQWLTGMSKSLRTTSSPLA